ncbi:unnamed protein product [Gongylonema pulchrum]|uniref:IgGFc_binding domain-containing protein n=1 Tax=Gongylonema pulchrum TaxID=637853 RepID=A0A183D4D0_9BILA|nr:unnamed protein product [Gongylonema pulchrum]
MTHNFNSCFSQIFGDQDATISTKLDEYDPISNWAPIPYTAGAAYYATATLEADFHTVSSSGRYIVVISGSNNGSAYSFVPAYNSAEINASSIGKEFVLIFPHNSDGNSSRLPEISVDLINPNSINVTVQILERRSSTPIAQNVKVPPHSVVKYQFDASTYTKLCAGKDSFVRCPDTSIAIQSSDPISVVAHNYLSGVAGDSYTGL